MSRFMQSADLNAKNDANNEKKHIFLVEGLGKKKKMEFFFSKKGIFSGVYVLRFSS